MANVSPHLLRMVPAALIRRHRVIPLDVEDETLVVGAHENVDAAVLRDMAFVTGKSIATVAVEERTIDDFLEAHVPEEETGPAVRSDRTNPKVALGSGYRGSVVQQVGRLIQDAIEQGASDIHVEPYEQFFRVRYRLDGVLHPVEDLSLLQRDAIISRLKILASLDIAEKRRPQDGRVRFPVGNRTVDLRVSTLPTDFGEKVVIRILDKTHLRLDLEALGFDQEALEAFRSAIRLPYGMILVTGPTGSGKTTTLYAALNALNTTDVNITTIEDPIEYNLPGINQTHVRSDIGFTFAKALRAFLRQDPNIIMVGEIRDRETAAIAVRAALTGHLVLSTIHTNDAPSTVTRLMDMGVEPYLVASSLRLVVAQRLVRKICEECRCVDETGTWLLDDPKAHDAETLYRGEGCPACSGTGYRGRTALYEVMPMSEELSDLVARRASLDEMRCRARQEGMETLREVALRRMYDGITTAAEVFRETGA